MAWNFIAIIVAVFVSVFCLMFPGSKNWADDRWARARQYHVEFPKLAIHFYTITNVMSGTSEFFTASLLFISI